MPLTSGRGQREAGAPQGAPASRPGPLLEITGLHISIPTEGGLIEAVRGVSFALRAGETIGVVGESVPGKTMHALSVLGIVPGAAQIGVSVRL